MRSRAARRRGELIPVPQNTWGYSPARLSAYAEASEHATSASLADPSSPLLALHAVLACHDAIRISATDFSRSNAQALGDEETLEVLISLSRLHGKGALLLVHLLRLTAPWRTTDGSDDAGGGRKKGRKEKGDCGDGGEGGAAATSPPVLRVGGGGGTEGGGGFGPSDGAVAEPEPSDPTDEARAITHIIVCYTHRANMYTVASNPVACLLLTHAPSAYSPILPS